MNGTMRKSAATGSLCFAFLACAPIGLYADDALTWEQKEQFLLNAKPVGGPKASKNGVTDTSRITLSSGKIKHDASIQTIDETRPGVYLGETNFKDSYRYNIAGWRLARLLGIDDMIPPSVERGFNGKKGSYTWWIEDVMFDEGERQSKNAKAPDQSAWNEEYAVVNVFDQLIYNVDRNRTNLLIDKQWRIWMIDHSRAFRLQKTLKDEKLLTQVDRQMLAKMKVLDKNTLKKETGAYLSASEIDGLLARRDLIVKFFEAKGESALFDRPKRN
jgi:hypothetical protein